MWGRQSATGGRESLVARSHLELAVSLGQYSLMGNSHSCTGVTYDQQSLVSTVVAGGRSFRGAGLVPGDGPG